MPVLGSPTAHCYRILVSRSSERPRALLYGFAMRDAIPPFMVPMRPGDSEPVVALQSLLAGLYERAGYDLGVDYRSEPVPPLSGADAAWADALLRAGNLR